MALVVADRVQETTSTTSTSSYALLGAATGYQSFGAVLANGDTTYYAITNDTDWEVGIGTYSTTGPTLARTTILASSSGGSAVNWGVGVKNIFISYAASKSVYLDASGNLSVADKIIHTGDTDTSIRFPAADTVSIETNGTERFKVENSTITTTVPIALPADPTLALQATTKQYVDTLIASGIHFHQPVRVENPANLNATYNNGTAGVGATLTNAGTQVALVMDGVTVATNDRVLVYEQTNQTQNGIYVVTNTGSGSTNWVLTRASDANTYVINSAAGLSEGSTVFVQQGTTGAGETYTCNTSGTITFGTTNITFAQISSAQIYSAGTGLALTGTVFSNTAPDQVVSLTQGGATTITGTYPNFTISSTDTTYTAGGGIGLAGTTFSVAAGTGLTQDVDGLSHADTSSQASVDNTGATFVQDINLDGFGHVTGAASVTVTPSLIGAPSTTGVGASGSWAISVTGTAANVTGTVAIANGGTGATTDSQARTNLGLAIGSNVQAYDAGLQSISGLTTSANQMIYTTASDTYATTSLTAAGRAILDDADAAAQRTTLGLGTIATQAASSVSITGGSISGITDLAVADGGTGASDAGTARTNLGLAIGSNVQAWDANLDQIAALAPTADNFIVGNGTAWVLETPANALASLGVTATAAELNFVDGVTSAIQTQIDAKAALASPALTGTPTAPTATAATSTTQIATTAFVTTADNLKANLASPALTGTPTAPTAAVATNTTQLATTAFVLANGGISNVNIQVFTATGTYTPTSGYKWGIAFVTGGGGGTYGNSTTGPDRPGAGAGGTAIGVLNLTTLGAVTATVGAGGTGGASAATNPGTSGGSSTLSTLTGGGGSLGGASTGGAGGTASGGSLNIVGGRGNDPPSGMGGGGGGSFWGSGGKQSSGAASSADAYGSGAGGQKGDTSRSGGTGAAGIIMIMEFK